LLYGGAIRAAVYFGDPSFGQDLPFSIHFAGSIFAANVPEFDHFTPASWLIRNPSLLDANTAEIAKTLDRAEDAFKRLNELL
jgi:hypothetical protein